MVILMHKIIKVNTKTAEKDAEGIVNNSETFLKNKHINIQPYNTMQAKKDYGLDLIVHARTFIKPDSDITTNCVLEVSSTEKYDVVYIHKWDLHYEILLELR